MATYSLTIQVDGLLVQKQSSDNLNIAKKVNGEFTTTFTGGSFKPIGTQQQLLQVNKFSWVDEYSVLLASKHVSGMLVSAATLPSQIAFGQQVDYDKGVLTAAAKAPAGAFTRSSAKDSFVLAAVPDRYAAAVATKVNGNWAPVFVGNREHNGTQSEQLTPMNEYAIFFDSTLTTESMIDNAATTNAYRFSFSQGACSMALRWGYKVPNSPVGVSEEPAWYPVAV